MRLSLVIALPAFACGSTNQDPCTAMCELIADCPHSSCVEGNCQGLYYETGEQPVSCQDAGVRGVQEDNILYRNSSGSSNLPPVSPHDEPYRALRHASIESDQSTIPRSDGGSARHMQDAPIARVLNYSQFDGVQQYVRGALFAQPRGGYPTARSLQFDAGIRRAAEQAALEDSDPFDLP